MHKFYFEMKNSPSRSSCKTLQYLWSVIAKEEHLIVVAFHHLFFWGKEEVRTSKIARYFIPRSPRFNSPFFQRFGSSSIPLKKMIHFLSIVSPSIFSRTDALRDGRAGRWNWKSFSVKIETETINQNIDFRSPYLASVLFALKRLSTMKFQLSDSYFSM